MANINIGGRLHSTATGNIVVGANEILDDSINKKQSEINAETYRLVENINNSLENLSPEQTEALSVAEKANNNEIKLGYFECETERDIAAKVITNAAGYILSKGGSIKIKMINDNIASNVTLNINSTGAKTLYYNNELVSPTNTWKNNEIIEVYYDGNNYYANNIECIEKFATGEKIKEVGIDNEPTAESENLIKSRGVYTSLKVLESEINTKITMLENAGYQFAGVATKDTNPNTPDTRVFYIANGKGVYTNFDGINVTENEVCVLYYDTAWHKATTGIASNDKLTELAKATIVSQEAISLPDFVRTAFCSNKATMSFESGYINCNVTVGSTVDLTPQTTTGTSNYCITNCSENTYFYIKDVIGGNMSRLYTFIDSNNKVLAIYPSNIASLAYTGIIKPPKYSAKVIFQRNNKYGNIYQLETINTIAQKDYPISETIGINKDNKFVVSPFMIFHLNGKTIYRPSNSGTILSPSENGFVVYNYSTNAVRFENNSSNILIDDHILAFYSYKEDVWYGGEIIEKNNAILTKRANHIFDLYTGVDASFTNNSVTLAYCLGIINNYHVLHYLRVNGVATKQTFTFNENGYLVYNAKNSSARFVTNYKSITKDELIWIYYKDGVISGGLLYHNYLAYKSSLQIEPSNIVFNRAQQLATIKWKAKNTIPTTSSATGISIGEHIGIPYTSCMEVDKFVGWDVSLKTFMTSANNPYSLLYTEDLNRNTSGYGFTYHGNRGTIGGYMGIVCNIFALYAACLPIPYDTGNWDYLRKIGVIKKLNEQDFKYVEIGDLVWEPGHGSIIVDIKKDNNKNVLSVKWAESVMDFPVINNFTTAQANSRLARNHGIIYRINGINKYLFYERSPFVSVNEESTDSITYNNDICTFAGDYAAFRKGQIIYLNYNLEEVGIWDSIELYKNDTLIDTLTIDVSAHRIDLTSLNLDYGKYKARMKHDNDYSDYTYFEIIDTTVSLSYAGSNMNVAFSSANGNPDYIRLCKIDGGPICIIPLTEEDVSKGIVEFNPQFYISRQGYSAVPGGSYLKVHFSGEYGCVTNEPILTNL